MLIDDVGRLHHAAMRPDKIGELLGITEEIRREAAAWNIGTLGGSPKARAEAARERHRLRDERRRRLRPGVSGGRAEPSRAPMAATSTDHRKSAAPLADSAKRPEAPQSARRDSLRA